jgi:Tol biopolymer transport system component
VFDAGSPLALAPDERRFAFSSAAANNDIWIYDLETARATRFSFEPGDEFGQVWMPDGTRIIYSAGGPDRLVMRNVNGSGPAVELLRSAAAAQTISPDGKQLVFTERGDKASADLWLMSLDDRTRRPLLRTPFNEFRAAFSPDARWLAYCSNQTGKMQAYVHSMAGDGEWQVSIDGAQGTGWSADGKEILFSDRYDFFAVPFSVAGKELRPGKPRKLFTIPGAESGVMMKNGNFLIMQDAPDLRPTQLNIVLGATR